MEVFKDVSTAVAAIIALIYIVQIYSKSNNRSLSLVEASNKREQGLLKTLDSLSDTISQVGQKLAALPDQAAAAYQASNKLYFEQVLKDHQSILKSQNIIADAIAPISSRLSSIESTIALTNSGAMEWHKASKDTMLRAINTSGESVADELLKLKGAIEPKLDTVIEKVQPLPEVRAHLESLAQTLASRDEAARQWFEAQQRSNAELRGELVQILTRLPIIEEPPAPPPPNLLPPGSMPATEMVADTRQEVTGVQ